MNRIKMVLCFLLALAIIVPLAVVVAPAVQADSDELPSQEVQADSAQPQAQVGAILDYWFPPWIEGWWYYAKGKCTYYDWLGHKYYYRDGWIAIPCQDAALGHTLQFYWSIPAFPEPGQTIIGKMPPEGMALPQKNMSLSQIEAAQAPPGFGPPDGNSTPIEPQAIAPGSTCSYANGYIGNTIYDIKSLKCKNKPRLSSMDFWGIYDDWPANNFECFVLNAQVKVNNDDWTAKSIKGTINGWGQYPPYLDEWDSSAVYVQYEFKFNAKPYAPITSP